MVVRIFFQSGLGWGGRRSSDSDRKGSGGALPAILIAVALIAVAWLLSVVIRFALSRSREYLADAGSVELTKNPDAMIMALRKIEGRGDIERANSAVMEMCIDNPRSDFSNLFDTHPPIEKRVEALIKFAGGHDPGPLALPAPQEGEDQEAQETQQETHQETYQDTAPAEPASPQTGPWGSGQQGGDKPFLPSRPPIELGGPQPHGTDPGTNPWGPRR